VTLIMNLVKWCAHGHRSLSLVIQWSSLGHPSSVYVEKLHNNPESGTVYGGVSRQFIVFRLRHPTDIPRILASNSSTILQSWQLHLRTRSCSSETL